MGFLFLAPSENSNVDLLPICRVAATRLIKTDGLLVMCPGSDGALHKKDLCDFGMCSSCWFAVGKTKNKAGPIHALPLRSGLSTPSPSPGCPGDETHHHVSSLMLSSPPSHHKHSYPNLHKSIFPSVLPTTYVSLQTSTLSIPLTRLGDTYP